MVMLRARGLETMESFVDHNGDEVMVDHSEDTGSELGEEEMAEDHETI